MGPQTTLNELRDLMDLLLDRDLAISTTEVVVDWLRDEGFQRITWANNSIAPGYLFRRESGTVEEYRDWLDNECYSAVLFDGSILQISFDFDGPVVARHRLLYFPCPFDLDAGLVNELPLVDIIDAYCDDYGINEVKLRSPVRFDYDDGVEAVDHPTTHMTFQWSRTRMPVGSPLSLGHFVHFVFQNFYPNLWKTHGFISNWPVDYATRTLRARERAYLHVDSYPRR